MLRFIQLPIISFGLAVMLVPSWAFALSHSYVALTAKKESKLIEIPESNSYSGLFGLNATNYVHDTAAFELNIQGFYRESRLLSSHLALVYKGLGLHLPSLSIAGLAGFHLPVRKYVRNELKTSFNRWIYGAYISHSVVGLYSELSYRVYDTSEKEGYNIDDFGISFQAFPYYEARAFFDYSIGPFVASYTLSYLSGLEGRYDVIFISDLQKHEPITTQTLEFGIQFDEKVALLANISKSSAKAMDEEKLLRLIGLHAFPNGINAYGLTLRLYN